MKPQHTHDDDQYSFSFTPLTTAIESMVSRLGPKPEKPQREGDTEESHQDEQKDDERRRYIEQRLNDLENFERMFDESFPRKRRGGRQP